jgi:REP element-mobilizing transposase RayT
MAPSRQRSLFSREVLARPKSTRGRPKKRGAGLPHLRRPPVDPRHPHHVTVRMRRGVWNLRTQRCFRPIAAALRAVRDREEFRVVHFSVQGNHLHLVVEADDRRAMTNGMRALLIRIARRLNALMDTRGRLYADRFHERILRTRSEVRNVVRYVLDNFRKHFGRRDPVDEFSSANRALDDALTGPPWAAPASWLLRVGWR